MELKDVLVAAQGAVDEAKIEPDLRVVAFEKAFDILWGGQQPQSFHEAQSDGAAGKGGNVGAGTPLERVAKKFGLHVEAVEQVYYVEGGELTVTVGSRKLSPRTASATKELALLVAAGRQAAGFEEWTSVDAIRSVCQDFKKLDASNFAGTITDMQDLFSYRGSARKRDVKVSRPGWDSAAELVKRLSNGGEG